MLKSTKVFLAALSVVSTMTLALPPAFAQMEADESSDMGEIDIVLNLPDAVPSGDGIPDLSAVAPAAGGEIAFSLPLPSPGDVVAAMRGGSSGWGRGPCPVGARGRGGCPLYMLEGENAVTSEQYEKLYSLKNSVLDARGPKVLEIMTAKRHLRDQLTRESIDEKTVKKLQNQITNAKHDLTVLEMDSKLQMMQILTGAQRNELRKAMVEGPKRGGGGSPFHHMMRKMMEKGTEGPSK